MAGVSMNRLANFESGREIPELEILDSLAGAMRVPVVRFFYDELDAVLTPQLTPRLTLQELVDEPPRSTAATMAALFSRQMIRVAAQKLLATVGIPNRRPTGKSSGSATPLSTDLSNIEEGSSAPANDPKSES